jgi:hypothetical protein
MWTGETPAHAGRPLTHGKSGTLRFSLRRPPPDSRVLDSPSPPPQTSPRLRIPVPQRPRVPASPRPRVSVSPRLRVPLSPRPARPAPGGCMSSLPKPREKSDKVFELAFFAVALALINLPLLSGGFRESMIFLPPCVAMGEWWRVVAHPFVHLTWYHLLLDAGAFLLLYSGLAEPKPAKRIGYVVVCALGSLLASTLVSPLVYDRGLCGLSGTAHGLMAISALESIKRQCRGPSRPRVL